MKTCTKCNTIKELINFYYNKTEKRYYSECKLCYNLRCKNYNTKNKDKINKYLELKKEEHKKRNREYKQSFAKYRIANDKISFCEKTRRDPNNLDLIQVTCKHCHTWFNPTVNNILKRTRALEGKIRGEHNFYCSDECKKNCPTFNQEFVFKGYKRVTLEDNTKKVVLKTNKEYFQKREVQAELREMVLERDNYTCIKCGNKEDLICHHIEGVLWEPIMSADIDMCITVCHTCHEDIHRIDGCRKADMKCNIK